MTVLEVIQRSADYLAQRGVESPRLQIELILAQVLHTPRLQLYLDFSRDLSEAEATQARAMVKRRAQREPLQHILGSTSFCGLELEVDPCVLIPRPETEILAEHAWNLLNAHFGGNEASKAAEDCRSPKASPSSKSQIVPPGHSREVAPFVLDLGTGSGCIAIAIASHTPRALVHAVDISPEALDIARRNAKRHNLSDRICFFESALFQAVPPATQYHLIATNPPYIPTAEIATLEPEVRDHDPLTALDGGPDGLAVIREIASHGPQYLVPGGALLMEFGDGQATAVRDLFCNPAWTRVTLEKDFSRRERILIAQRDLS